MNIYLDFVNQLPEDWSLRKLDDCLNYELVKSNMPKVLMSIDCPDENGIRSNWVKTSTAISFATGTFPATPIIRQLKRVFKPVKSSILIFRSLNSNGATFETWSRQDLDDVAEQVCLQNY